MKRYGWMLAVLGGWVLVGGEAGAENPSNRPERLPPASFNKLPRWRGFNLLEKFMLPWSNKPFVEKDFRLIQQLGFNFVRLPMDYRVWIEGQDWEKFREPVLKEIDQAVEWGNKYQIHVSINFHRAPGYTVASPSEAKSLWTDPEAQRVCAKHWAMFARRYKGIPNDRLSFNLFNEPAGVEEAIYVKVVRGIVQAIREEDPERLIISDGLQWGTKPIPLLAPLKLAQATRGYAPMELTHYKANWVGGADRYPVPTWPILMAYGTLFGKSKPELQRPMVLDGLFPKETRLTFRVGTVSTRCLLLVDADGKTVLKKDFVCGPGQGEWKKAEYKPQWKIYQNYYDRDYEAVIPAGTREIRLHVGEGDWMQITRLNLKPDGDAAGVTQNLITGWDQKPAHLSFVPGPEGGKLIGKEYIDREYLQRTMIQPWKQLEGKGVGIMVGEFGAFNQTPHPVTLAWMEDCLKNWKEAGWGWALWNFRGSFGVLDSDRPDVIYEEFQGHKMDRKMLDLLQKY